MYTIVRLATDVRTKYKHLRYSMYTTVRLATDVRAKYKPLQYSIYSNYSIVRLSTDMRTKHKFPSTVCTGQKDAPLTCEPSTNPYGTVSSRLKDSQPCKPSKKPQVQCVNDCITRLTPDVRTKFRPLRYSVHTAVRLSTDVHMRGSRNFRQRGGGGGGSRSI